MFTVAWPCNAGLTSWSADRLFQPTSFRAAGTGHGLATPTTFSLLNPVFLSSKRSRLNRPGVFLVRAHAQLHSRNLAVTKAGVVQAYFARALAPACMRRPSSLTRVSRALAENGQGGE